MFFLQQETLTAHFNSATLTDKHDLSFKVESWLHIFRQNNRKISFNCAMNTKCIKSVKYKAHFPESNASRSKYCKMQSWKLKISTVFRKNILLRRKKNQ